MQSLKEILVTEKYEEPLRLLKATAEKLRAEHEKWCSWDGGLYNVGTVVILLCNVAAAVIPTAPDGWMFWLPKVLLGIATFGIALEHAKSYGLRWQFHIGKKNQWDGIVDRINVFPAWPDEDKDVQLKTLVEDISRLRSTEGAIPGTAPVDSPKPRKPGE
jgi:hypothetical protein